jgi:hypothetical protein
MSLDPDGSRDRSPNRNGGNVRSLVLRAWLEPGACPSLRVRLVEIDAGRNEQPVIVTTSIDHACQTVRRWLETLPVPGGGW